MNVNKLQFAENCGINANKKGDCLRHSVVY